MLVLAWLTASMDAVHSIDQRGWTFWGRVHAHYDEHKMPNFCVHSMNSITNWWSMIQVDTKKFCACLVQIEARHPSGASEQDKA